MFSDPEDRILKKPPRCLVHLWEFLLELLMDDSFTPIIQWTDETNGEFRIKNCEAVAKKWGTRKQKYNMNYDKLSRSLRYYYKKDIIKKVSGRRFVYKFVPTSEMRRAVETIKTSMMRQGRRNVSVGPFSNRPILTEKIATSKQSNSNITENIFYQSSPSPQQSSESYQSSSPSPPINEAGVFFKTDKKRNTFETENNLLFSNDYIKNDQRKEKSIFFNPGIFSDIEHTLHPSYDDKKQIIDKNTAIHESSHNKAFGLVKKSNDPMLNKVDVLSEQYRFQDEIMKDYNVMRQKSTSFDEIHNYKNSMVDSPYTNGNRKSLEDSSYPNGNRKPYSRFSQEHSVQTSQQFLYNRQKYSFADNNMETKQKLETLNECTRSKIYEPLSVNTSIIKPSVIRLSDVLDSLNDTQLESDQNEKRNSSGTKNEEHFYTYPVINRLLQSKNVKSNASPRRSPDISTYQLPPGYVLRKQVPLIDASTQTTHASELYTTSVITSRNELTEQSDIHFKNWSYY